MFMVVFLVVFMMGWCSASVVSEAGVEFRFEGFDFGFYFFVMFLVIVVFTGMEFLELGRAV